MIKYLNFFCGIENSSHTLNCNNGGSSTYDTLSGVTFYDCSKKASWHDFPVEKGEACQNLCYEHARSFRKFGRSVKPYAGKAKKIEIYYVTKSPISYKSLKLPIILLVIIVYGYFH